ncbi:hypothetical protein L840_4328 [Mycobacterium sp. MAC_011194_8550]|nr:hypothetical protein L840_4328 [Mycobacterium sp. MAC_011194_8550]
MLGQSHRVTIQRNDATNLRPVQDRQVPPGRRYQDAMSALVAN